MKGGEENRSKPLRRRRLRGRREDRTIESASERPLGRSNGRTNKPNGA
jgi:hypothetical protein